MSRERLAAAYDALAEASAQIAHELRGIEPAPVAVPESGGAVPPQRSPAPASPTGGVNVNECPKHHVPWTEGNYGPYCKQMTDDPAWGKAKKDRDGNDVLWCKLTPKNAPAWVGVHKAAAEMDVDDVPF